ncbi:hypothetical protein GCM10023148_12220 [Actinokineospora soli]
MRTTLISLRLRMTTPGGVTAPEHHTDGLDPDTHVLPLRTDTAGNPHLPGTTIAGSLRAHCRDTPTLADAFGPTPGDQRAASPIQILGTLHRTPNIEPVTRLRTRIDRHRRAPATHTLHGVQQLPAGTEFDIVLRWDNPHPTHLTALLHQLTTWTPALGRATSTGAGQCAVTALAHHDYDLTTPTGLLAWLTDTPYPEPEPLTTPATPPEPIITLTFAIVDALHIGTGTHTTTDDGHQLFLTHRADTTPTIPGTTLKGALRSRVEYICRVLDHPACTTQTCGHCHPCQIFGHSNTDGTAARARIRIHDTPITNPTIEHHTHVALDRVTGGAAPRLLYTLEAITGGTFTLTITALSPLTTIQRLLLDAAITDLHDGHIGIGGHTTRGYGSATITTPTWQPPDLTTLHTHLTTETP